MINFLKPGEGILAEIRQERVFNNRLIVGCYRDKSGSIVTIDLYLDEYEISISQTKYVNGAVDFEKSLGMVDCQDLTDKVRELVRPVAFFRTLASDPAGLNTLRSMRSTGNQLICGYEKHGPIETVTVTKIMFFDHHAEVYEEDWQDGVDLCQRHLGTIDTTELMEAIEAVLTENRPAVTFPKTDHRSIADYRTALTPMLIQWSYLKDQFEDFYTEDQARSWKIHREVIVLWRVGDFYEAYFQDAVTIARELELVETTKQGLRNGDRVPLAGIPHHAIDRYCRNLVGKKWTIAIAEEVRGLDDRTLLKREFRGTCQPMLRRAP